MEQHLIHTSDLHHNRKNQKQHTEPEEICLVEGNKSPVKYSYLETEQSHEQRREWEIFWLQFFAMFIFIFASTCSHSPASTDLQFFVGVMMAIPICAKQTGANLNPAVTFSLAFKATGVPILYQTLLWIYIKAQVLGAVLAAWIAVTVNHVSLQPASPGQAAPLQVNVVPFSLVAQVILSEAVGMFILIFLILYGTGPYSFISSDGAKYFYIAVFVYIGRKFAPASENQINVALTFSRAVVGIINCDFTGFHYLLAWVLGDLLGVIVATFLYLKFVEPTRDYLEKHQTTKVMNKLNQVHESQLKERKRTVQAEQEISENKGYYRKLEYY